MNKQQKQNQTELCRYIGRKAAVPFSNIILNHKSKPFLFCYLIYLQIAEIYSIQNELGNYYGHNLIPSARPTRSNIFPIQILVHLPNYFANQLKFKNSKNQKQKREN